MNKVKLLAVTLDTGSVSVITKHSNADSRAFNGKSLAECLDKMTPTECAWLVAFSEVIIATTKDHMLAKHRAEDPHCTCNDCIQWEQDHSEGENHGS